MSSGYDRNGRLGPNSSEPFPDVAGVTIIETIVSPFHCLYQDALFFHTQSQLRIRQGLAGESSRFARSAFLLYLTSAEALVHQAAWELGRPELSGLVADPSRPMTLGDVWRLLPAIMADNGSSASATMRFDPTVPPWPQFAELLALRQSWSYPGPPDQRRAYYRACPDPDAGAQASNDFEPLEPHDVPAALGLPADRLQFARTGLPRDPYALRPHHLDTARSVLDAAVAAIDRRLGGALTKNQRHRREPVRIVHPPQNQNQGQAQTQVVQPSGAS